MDVDRLLAERVRIDPELLGPGSHIGEPGPCRLLHHVAELPGEDDLVLALHAGRLDLHDVAARVGHHQAGGHPDLVLGLQLAVVEARRAQVILQLGGLDHDLDLAVVRHAASDLAGQVGDLTLQVADARLPSVVADQGSDRIVGDLDIFLVQPRLFHLLLDQELFGNFDLFRLGVTVQPQYFHAVLQSGRNGMHHIGGGHKEDLR